MGWRIDQRPQLNSNVLIFLHVRLNPAGRHWPSSPAMAAQSPAPCTNGRQTGPPTARFDVNPLNLFRRGGDHTDEGAQSLGNNFALRTSFDETTRHLNRRLRMTFRSHRTARSVARTIAVAGLLTGVAIAAPAPATSKTSFDGIWSVLIVTEKGVCDRGYRYAIRITNGVVGYAGE